MSRILVIEDDTQMRDLLCRILQQAGYDTVPAINGEQGVRLYQRKNIDLVITDIYMPEKDGLEVDRELCATDPLVEIAAISGGWNRGFFSPLNHAEVFGAVETIKKPFENEEILKIVKKLIDGKNHE